MSILKVLVIMLVSMVVAGLIVVVFVFSGYNKAVAMD